MSINQDAGFLIKRISDTMDKHANRALKKDDLTFAQGKLLVYLIEHRDQKTSQKDIERYFSVSHPTVIGLLKRMEDKDLVRISTDDADGRVRLVNLTVKAEKSLQNMRIFFDEMEVALLQGLDDCEVVQFKRLLKKVSDNIQPFTIAD